MVTKDEFGSLIAEYEGFRDTILDEMANLRRDLEKIRFDLEDLQDKVKDHKIRLDEQQRKLR